VLVSPVPPGAAPGVGVWHVEITCLVTHAFILVRRDLHSDALSTQTLRLKVVSHRSTVSFHSAYKPVRTLIISRHETDAAARREQGFDRIQAGSALARTFNHNAEAAINWIVEHPDGAPESPRTASGELSIRRVRPSSPQGTQGWH
jgi:hypothetical protein